MSINDHSVHSSYRESVVEHIMVGELLRHMWASELGQVEVLKPQVDDSGYDFVLEQGATIRHVQLKVANAGGRTRQFNVHARLAEKPSACVIVAIVDPRSLEVKHYQWYGGVPGAPLPSLEDFDCM